MGSDLAVLWRVLRLFGPYRRWMLLGALLSTLTVLASVGLMAIAGYFIAAMAVAGLAGVLMNYFLPAAGIRLLAIVRTGGRYVERVATHEATFRLLAELRVWLFRKLIPLAPARLAHARGADLAARVQGDVETLQHACLRLYAPMLTAVACTGIVTCLVALRSAAAALALLVLLLAAGLAVPLAVRRASAASGAAIVQSNAALRVAVVDALQGMADVAVYGASERTAGNIAALDDRLLHAQRRADTLGLAAEGAVGLCAGFALLTVALVAIVAAQTGTIDPVEVPMLALAALAAFEAVQPLPLAMQRAGEVVAAARRIFGVADLTAAVTDPAAPSPEAADASIVLRGVHLRHDGAVVDALAGVDLAIASGRTVAIAGPSGAGKSSLASLLVRFHEYRGEALLGGVELRAWRQEDARRFVSVAEQHVHLLRATMRENLLLANPHATDADLRAAIEAAQLSAFVAALPQGLDTQVGEGGVRLSAGQARRLAVGRVLLRDSPVVVLDEPTEGLDTHTGRALLEAVTRRLAGRTLLVITHDLGQLRGLVDGIVVMSDGRVVSARPA